MTSWSEAEPAGRTALFYTLKNKNHHKKVPDGLAWLLLTDDDEYRFSCSYQFSS
jgi:hypothetical protein